MLGGDDHVVDAHGLAVHVFEGHLGLAVGAEEVHDAVLAYAGELEGKLVGPVDGGGHQGGGFVRGEAEHHALVASALIFRVFADNALGDIGGLLVDSGEHGAGLSVEAHFGAGVADILDGLTNDGGEVGVTLGGDLAGDDGHAGGHEGLTGHVGVGILLEQGVEHGIGDLVSDFVGMAFGHGFRSEEVSAFGGDHGISLMFIGKTRHKNTCGKDGLASLPQPYLYIKLW